MNTNHKEFSNKKILVILLFLVIIGAFFRFYQLGKSPASISWDEAAVGYNAWAVSHFGIDEWGNRFPLVFKSFLDDKHPVHIYMTAITVKLFGLSEFSTRLSSSIFGVLNILMAFFLAKQLFKSRLTGIIVALLFVFNPYAYHYSRFNHELNFAVFFMMLSIYLFLKAVDGKKNLLPLSTFFFGITFISYHSPKVVIPPLLILLGVAYFKQLIKIKHQVLISFFVLLFWIAIILLNPGLLGGARVKQTSFSDSEVKRTPMYEKTGNLTLGWANIVFENYKKHISYDYLFKKGDQNPRLANHITGQFYPIDLFFILAGVIFLLLKRNKTTLILLFLVTISPIPASLVNESPHSARAMYMLPAYLLVSGFGIYSLLKLFKNKYGTFLLLLTLFFYYTFQFNQVFNYYISGEFDKKNAIEFQYGLKEIVKYADINSQYFQVFMTDVRSQPYIFFLYYLQVPPLEFLKTVQYNNSKSRSYNLVSSFDKFNFGFDEIESFPYDYMLYIVEDSKYGGLRYKDSFKIVNPIKFPDGGTAFYMVSKN